VSHYARYDNDICYDIAQNDAGSNYSNLISLSIVLAVLVAERLCPQSPHYSSTFFNLRPLFQGVWPFLKADLGTNPVGLPLRAAETFSSCSFG